MKLSVLVTTILLTFNLQACGHGKAACAVIDVAHTACETLPIKYLDKDGNVKVEHVPLSEIEWSIRRSKAARGVKE
jgi:hypothetical protein